MTEHQKQIIIEAFKADQHRRKLGGGPKTAFNPQQFLANLQTVLADLGTAAADVGPFIADIIQVLVVAGVLTPGPAPTPAPDPTPSP
jgi:hypothetical protein